MNNIIKLTTVLLGWILFCNPAHSNPQEDSRVWFNSSKNNQVIGSFGSKHGQIDVHLLSKMNPKYSQGYEAYVSLRSRDSPDMCLGHNRSSQKGDTYLGYCGSKYVPGPKASGRHRLKDGHFYDYGCLNPIEGTVNWGNCKQPGWFTPNTEQKLVILPKTKTIDDGTTFVIDKPVGTSLVTGDSLKISVNGNSDVEKIILYQHSDGGAEKVLAKEGNVLNYSYYPATNLDAVDQEFKLSVDVIQNGKRIKSVGGRRKYQYFYQANAEISSNGVEQLIFDIVAKDFVLCLNLIDANPLTGVRFDSNGHQGVSCGFALLDIIPLGKISKIASKSDQLADLAKALKNTQKALPFLDESAEIVFKGRKVLVKREFRSLAKHRDHFRRHGSIEGYYGLQDYVHGAYKLATADESVDILRKYGTQTDKIQNIYTYDKVNNFIVVVGKDGEILSYYKPRRGIRYFFDQ